MQTALSVFTLLWLLICFAATALPQEVPALLQGAETIIKTKHPSFEFVEKKQLSEKEVVYRWRSPEGGMRLLVFYGASGEEATEKMKLSIDRISVGPDKKLTGVGDEAYLWIGHGRDHGVVRFRKSNVYVDLSAPSVALAEDLATNLANIIKGK